AAHINLEPATGLTLALVRKLRLAFWSAIGLALLLWRRVRVLRPQLVSPALAAAVLLAVARGVSAQEAGAAVAGTVAIVGPDGAPLSVPGVTVTLRCGSDEPRTEVSNDEGAFRFADVPPGRDGCSIVAELQGFASSTTSVAITAGATTTADLQLRLDTLREEVTVRAAPTSI